MDKKKFEKTARMLLKYGIGHNIEESQEKLQALIKTKRVGLKIEVVRLKRRYV